MPILGIVVTVYNKKAYVEKCITSVLSQSFDDWELIIVDDGSSDGSEVICDRIKGQDKRIKVIHQENLGPIKARKRGVEESISDYITFIDADDWVSGDTFGLLHEYMEKKVDCIMYPIIRFINETSIIEDKCVFEAGIYNRSDMERDIIPTMLWNVERGMWDVDPSLCNKVIKRDIILKELKRASMLSFQYGEDVAVIYPLLYKTIGMFAISDKGAYFHRKNEKNELPRYILDNKYISNLCRLYEYLREAFESDNSLQEQLDRFFASSSQLRLKKYPRAEKNCKRYLFPYQLIEKDSGVVIYGAGRVGQDYWEQLMHNKYARLVAWVDKNADRYRDLGVESIESLKRIENIDYYVIAIANRSIADSVKKRLVEMHISVNRIVWNVEEM